MNQFSINVGIQIVSFIMFIAIAYEYIYINSRNLQIFKDLHDPNVLKRVRERKKLLLSYFVVLVCTVIPMLFL